MKQILHRLRDGAVDLVETPAPKLHRGLLLCHTSASLLSAGTERMLVEFGEGSWLGKARQQPDKVRMVLEKARIDGIPATLEVIQSKLDQPLALGYSNVGRIRDTGDVAGFSVGDRVVSNGPHAEVVSVRHNLCAQVPHGVTDEQAAFTVLGAIGLQGIRLAYPTLGESVVVTGLGLIGLLTVQMLRAQGCRVMGIDPDPARCALAEQFGAEVTVDPTSGTDVVESGMAFSRGRGVDAVLITAATNSNEPVSQAARMSRKRGRIVLVGVTGLELSRADFYEKELSFQVSCSYGPGRYDPSYEERGQDYPVGFVRWTEQRNFEAVLDMMASGALDVEPLITHRFPFEKAPEAYELLTSGDPSLGILLEYSNQRDAEDLHSPIVRLRDSDEPAGGEGTCRVAFLGAGNYASRVLIPAFKAAGAELDTLVSAGGVSATHYGGKFGFAKASTDWQATVEGETVNTVVIATRHDAHAQQVISALQAGKHVFCEKPLCLTMEELEEITQALEPESNDKQSQTVSNQHLMVGFNRRFSPHIQKMKSLLETVDEPMNLVMTVNAGEIPSDHWTQDREVGGGRIVGEACHFIDLLRYLADSPISGADGLALGQHPALATRDDKATLVLQFENGSVGTIHYLANGHRSFPKERLEVFCAGRVLQLDNFRKLRGWGWKGFSGFKTWRQDKGVAVMVEKFTAIVSDGGMPLIPIEEILEVSRISIELANSL